MLSPVFALMALCHFGLFLWSLRLPPSGFPLLFLRCLLVALSFDNLVIALGPLLHASTIYGAMSTLRFWVHAMLLPFLLVFVAGVMSFYIRRVQIRLWLSAVACVLALLAVVYGYLYDLASLELVAADYYPRLVAADSQPPFATIAVNLLAVIAGAWLWRRANWPWLFAGALQIFLVNGATAGRDWSFIAGNTAELLFVISLFASLKAVIRPEDAAAVPERGGAFELSGRP
jgi:hypothetical protein